MCNDLEIHDTALGIASICEISFSNEVLDFIRFVVGIVVTSLLTTADDSIVRLQSPA